MKKILLCLISIFILMLNLSADKVSSLVNTTKRNEVNSSLTIVNNTLVKRQYYLTSTNKFNCNSMLCTESSFSDIGLMSLFEYNRYGYYLEKPTSFYIIDDNDFKIINYNKVENVDNNSVSGLRPNVYVKKGTRVTGSGRKSDPWIFVGENDNNKPIIIDVKFTPELYKITADVDAKDNETGIREYCFSIDKGDYVCQKSNIYTFTNLTDDTEYLIDIYVLDEGFNRTDYPTTKVRTLYITYSLKINVTNGTATPSNTLVKKGTDATISLVPNNNYNFTTSSLVCDNGAVGSLSGNTLIVKNITSDNVCSIKANVSYVCSEGTLKNDSSKGYICVKSSSFKKGAPYDCDCRTITTTIKDCDICGCVSWTEWCRQNASSDYNNCITEGGVIGGTLCYGCKSCSSSDYVCYDTCYYPDEYYCPNGWSNYSGSGTSLTCYRRATKAN